VPFVVEYTLLKSCANKTD